MNNSIVSFAFHDRSVRTAQKEDGSIWFCLADVLAAIESKTNITQSRIAIEEALGGELLIKLPMLDANNHEQLALFVSDAAITFLLTRSRTEAGKALNKFIHCEVLPSIRKTGTYSVAPTEQVPQPQKALPSAVEYATAVKICDELKDSRLTRLLRAKLEAEMSLGLVLEARQLPQAEELERYTTITVRASELGYKPSQIGSGGNLGKFVKSAISPDFQDQQGQYLVWHYKVTEQLDARIHAYFG